MLAGAFAAFGAATGRAHAAVSAHQLKGARVVLLAQGAAVETAEAVADALRSDRVKVGVVGLRALRPFPAAELVEALRGARAVAVLERIDAPLGSEPPLLAEVRALLARARENQQAGREVHPGLPALAERETPRLTSVLYGLGGFPLRAADLAALRPRAGRRPRQEGARRGGDRSAAQGSGARPGEVPSPVYLGLAMPPAASPYPKRQAALDDLRRSYPEGTRLGFRADAPAPERPAGTSMLTVHRLAGQGGDGLAGDAGRLLYRVAGGHLRSRRDLAAAWGTPCVDRVVYAKGAVRDPGDGAAADFALWHRPAPPAAADAPALLAGLRPGGALLVEVPGDHADDLESWWVTLPAEIRDAAGAGGGGRLRLYTVPAGAAGTTTAPSPPPSATSGCWAR